MFTKTGKCYLVEGGVPDYSMFMPYTYEGATVVSYRDAYMDSNGNITLGSPSVSDFSWGNSGANQNYTEIQIKMTVISGTITLTDTGVIFTYTHSIESYGKNYWKDDIPYLETSISPLIEYRQSDYAPTDYLPGDVIWEKVEGQEFTTDGYSVYLNLDNVIDLTGYKYLNVKFSATDNATDQNVIVQPMNETNGAGHPQGSIKEKGAVSKNTYQTEFGTTFGTYSKWENDTATEVKIKDNLLGSLQLFAESTVDWKPANGVKITIYKVTATNTEQK